MSASGIDPSVFGPAAGFVIAGMGLTIRELWRTIKGKDVEIRRLNDARASDLLETVPALVKSTEAVATAAAAVQQQKVLAAGPAASDGG